MSGIFTWKRLSNTRCYLPHAVVAPGGALGVLVALRRVARVTVVVFLAAIAENAAGELHPRSPPP
eukprot:4027851-Pyramimonas_sp.AAC.1